MIARLRQVQKSPQGWRAVARRMAVSPLLLFLKQRSKLISPAHVVRMSLLQRIELLTRRGWIAPEFCQEINNSALLGDLPFRDIHLSYSLHELVHHGLSAHLPTSSP